MKEGDERLVEWTSGRNGRCGRSGRCFREQLAWRGAGPSSFFRVDRQNESSCRRRRGPRSAMPRFLVVVEAVDHLDEGPQLARVRCISITLAFSRMSHHCQSVWCEVGEVGEHGLLGVNQTADGHRRPGEHDRVPEMVVEGRFAPLDLVRRGGQDDFLPRGEVLFACSPNSVVRKHLRIRLHQPCVARIDPDVPAVACLFHRRSGARSASAGLAPCRAERRTPRRGTRRRCLRSAISDCPWRWLSRCRR